MTKIFNMARKLYSIVDLKLIICRMSSQCFDPKVSHKDGNSLQSLNEEGVRFQKYYPVNMTYIKQLQQNNIQPLQTNGTEKMINFALLVNKLRKTRLIQFYDNTSENQRQRIINEVSQQVVERLSKGCNVIEWRDKKLVFRRYASLYFIFCIDNEDNELTALETIQFFVECLDKYFGNVCELDLIFNYHKAYHILDEMIIGGYLSETSKKTVLKAAQAHDQLESGGDTK